MATGETSIEVVRRRKLLAELMVKQQDHGITFKELADRLHEGRTRINRDGEIELDPSSYSRNPAGNPWSTSTIEKDMKAIREDWRTEATRSIASHKQEILAGYQKMLEIYWGQLDLEGVNKVYKEIRVMLGTDTDRIAVWEGIREQMDIAAKRLRADFGHDPVLLAAIYRSISGASEAAKDLESLN